MQAVYVLTTSGGDKFVDMAYLSMCTLNNVHKNIKVLCIIDKCSLEKIRRCGHSIRGVVDEFVHVDVDHDDKRYVNRYMKCRMRKLVEGDFLYLDADTLPVGELNALFQIENSFAAASNHSTEFPDNFFADEKAVFAQNGWSLPQSMYVNGGVLYWRDTDAAHELADRYIAKWTECANRRITTKDQPALNAALVEWEGHPEIIDSTFNAQICNNPLAGIDAKVWHFYASQGEKKETHMEYALHRLNDDSFNVDQWAATVCNRRLPWMCGNRRSDSALASLMLKKGRTYNHGEYLWAERNYKRWIKYVAKKAINRMKRPTKWSR